MEKFILELLIIAFKAFAVIWSFGQVMFIFSRISLIIYRLRYRQKINLSFELNLKIAGELVLYIVSIYVFLNF